MARKVPSLVDTARRRIRELRTARGLTQEELCERAGISIDAVSRIEGGSRAPTLDTIERLAKAFSVSPVVLLDGGSTARANEAESTPTATSVRRVLALLDGQPEALQKLAEQTVTALVRAFSLGRS